MTRKEYIKELLDIYTVVNIIKSTETKEVIRVRHRKLGKDMVIRSYPHPVPAYDFLCGCIHKNIPIVYDTYTVEDGEIVLEEYISGITVDEIIENKSYTYRGAKEVLTQICDALEFLHGSGFVHRDIKPENIMVSDDGCCKLMDFDVSKEIRGDKNADTDILGTVGYASPEQYGIAQSDARSDIYALGILLNVMLTGKHPSELLVKGKAGRIVLKSTQINPEQRFNSVNEFRKAL